MAELVSKHSHIRVDMTPMVDLAFLLVTFFMLTTTFSKPNIMQLSMPVPDTQPGKVSAEITTTLVLDGDNRIFYIQGLENPQVTETSYAPGGLRKLLIEQIKVGHRYGKDAIFIIKPTSKATYQNVVDALDEMKISNARVYAVQELQPQEKNLIENHKTAQQNSHRQAGQ